MSHSCFIIKPEAVEHSGWIFRELEKAKLSVTLYLQTRLPIGILKQLYPDNMKDPELREATLRHLAWHECVAGLVLGREAAEKLVQVCGEDTNPNLCAPGTIRREFGLLAPDVLPSGRRYWRNAIHRPKPSERFFHMALVTELCGRRPRPGLLS